MTDREIMQQALEALEYAAERIGCPDDDDAIGVARKALRERLAQPEQEPVAWISEGGDVSRSKRYMDEMGFECNPLYAAPQRREWVGLTDEQMAVLNFMLGADDLDGVWFGERHPKEKGAFWWRNRLRNAFQDAAIEAKLKEKNA